MPFHTESETFKVANLDRPKCAKTAAYQAIAKLNDAGWEVYGRIVGTMRFFTLLETSNS